jgi:hypothetical protein
MIMVRDEGILQVLLSVASQTIPGWNQIIEWRANNVKAFHYSKKAVLIHQKPCSLIFEEHISLMRFLSCQLFHL